MLSSLYHDFHLVNVCKHTCPSSPSRSTLTCPVLALLRYLMYLKGPGEVYMVDRNNSVFEAPQLSFPARKRPGDCVKDTLVDGVRAYSSVVSS